MSAPRINSTDKAGPLWRALVEHYTAHLAMLREKNDAQQSPEKTDFIRGQIAEVKAFLSLADEPPRRQV